MAREKFFSAHELVPQAGMASETTRALITHSGYYCSVGV